MEVKQLKIKYGVLKRVKKDLEYYNKDFVLQQAKITKMRQEGKEQHDIKQQENVLQETEMMLPDCQNRLDKALEDLQTIFKIQSENEEVKKTELFQEIAEYLANEEPGN